MQDEPHMGSSQGVHRGHQSHMDDDEFDDPMLLQQQMNKQGAADKRQPGMGQPGMGQPGMGQPGMGQPGMGQPGMGQPGMGQPGMGQPGMGMGMPGMGQPGMGMPMGQPAHEQQDDQSKFAFSLYELLMLVFVIIFIGNCLIGKKFNENYAQNWYVANKDFFEENYAHVGVGTEYNTTGAAPLLKESYNNFKFYASGRVFTKWMLVALDFKKRQDLVSNVTSAVLYNEKDRLIYESSITPSNDIPVVLCICKKKDVKSMKKSYSDIDFFTKTYNPNYMSDNLVLLTEDIDVISQMMDDKTFLASYKAIESNIDIIYFTDRQTYTKEQHAVFFSFDINVSKSNINETFKNITLFVHQFIDLLCNVRISASQKKDAERLRTDYDKVRAKELAEKSAEEAKQKKQEKHKDKRSKALTVVQAQRLDEKEKKESTRMQKKKQVKVMKK